GYNKAQKITFDIFEKIRFTTKDELRVEPNLLLSVPMNNVSQIHTSTGTSGGDNIYMMYTNEDLYGADLEVKFKNIGLMNKDSVVTVALPYEMSSSGQAFHRVSQFVYGAAVIPVGKGGAYSEPQKAIKIMADMKSTILFTSPSYAVELLKAAKTMGVNVVEDIKLKTIWLTGEGCSNAFRRKIEKQWNCEGRFYYGSLEGGGLAVECENNKGYHILEGHAYVEIINPVNGEKLEDGEIGEIVITTLLREGTPLIRYRTEDLGYIESEECDCEVTLKKLFLRGRKIDEISVGYIRQSPIYLEDFLMRIKGVGNNYKFVVHEDYMEVVVEVDNDIEDKNDLAEYISSTLEYHSGITIKVTLVNEIAYVGKKVRRVEYKNI
ncbi:MAG: phenylacetate--CoA ligase family protein, partial [Clostridium sp.]